MSLKLLCTQAADIKNPTKTGFKAIIFYSYIFLQNLIYPSVEKVERKSRNIPFNICFFTKRTRVILQYDKIRMQVLLWEMK